MEGGEPHEDARLSCRTAACFLSKPSCCGSRGRSPSSEWQSNAGRAAGFTLPEILTVMLILGILASMLSVGVRSAQRQAKQTHCKSNLRQFGVGIQIYRGDHSTRNPPWLSSLYPDYIESKHLYICKSDINAGNDRVIPEALTKGVKIGTRTQNATDYKGIEDNDSNGQRPNANTDIHRCSYFYEFSVADAPAGWVNDEMNERDFDNDLSRKTWCDYKESQLRFGDAQSDNHAYSESQLPIIRCWHHYDEMRVDARPEDHKIDIPCPANQLDKSCMTINVAYAGNVYVGPLKWECTVQPGDRGN